MASVAFGMSYTLENDKRFIQTLKDASEIVSDLRIPFGLISRDFYRSELSIFKLKGPGLYPPFKNSARASSLGGGVGLGAKKGSEVDITKSPYQRKKLKKFGFDYPLLVATGRLAASITTPNAPGSLLSITKLSMVIGTTVPYGIYHQSDAPRSKIPQRKFVFIGPEAPRFATSQQQGRLERWTGYIESYVIKSYIKKGIT